MVAARAEAQGVVVYEPKLAVPDFMGPFLKHLEPGSDAFTAERDVAELQARLNELGHALRPGRAKAAGVWEWLLAPGFRGGRLTTDEEMVSPATGPLEVSRASKGRPELSLDARSFGAEIRRLVDDLRDVTVTEFLITSIELPRYPEALPQPTCATTSSAPGQQPGASSTWARGG